MAPPLPDLTNLRELQPWGPFPRTSQRRWAEVKTPGSGSLIGLANYHQTMIATGTPEAQARRVVARLHEHGCQQMFWRAASGGRRRHVHAFWDVRVATTTTPASEAVRAVTSMGSPPPGACLHELLTTHPNVLQAYSTTTDPRNITGHQELFGGRITVRVRNHLRFTHHGYAALAADHVGATISVAGASQPAADTALSYLAQLLLRDLSGH